MKSPKIDAIEWGKTTVNGQVFKDVKLFPGGAAKWDWSETNTHHVPGIQIADLSGLLDADIIILSKGYNQRLQCMGETLEYLNNTKKIVYHLQTEKAVEKYNACVDSGAKVAALIHSTC